MVRRLYGEPGIEFGLVICNAITLNPLLSLHVTPCQTLYLQSHLYTKKLRITFGGIVYSLSLKDLFSQAVTSWTCTSLCLFTCSFNPNSPLNGFLSCIFHTGEVCVLSWIHITPFLSPSANFTQYKLPYILLKYFSCKEGDRLGIPGLGLTFLSCIYQFLTPLYSFLRTPMVVDLFRCNLMAASWKLAALKVVDVPDSHQAFFWRRWLRWVEQGSGSIPLLSTLRSYL